MDQAKMMPKASMIGATQQDMMWHAGTPNAPSAHGAVSVVTTVYSNVPRFSGTPQSFNTPTMHPNSAPNVYGVGNGPSTGPSYVGAPTTMSKPSTYCGDNSYAYDHHHQTYSAPVPPEYTPSAPQQAALNAAQVAAAAVATATATAVAIDQSQFQPYHPGQQPTPYSNGPYQQSVGVVPPGPYGANPRMIQQRSSMPSSYMPTVRATRPQQATTRYPIGSAKGALPGAPAYSNGQHMAPYMASVPPGQPMMSSVNQQRPMMQPSNGHMYPNSGPSGGYNPRLMNAAMRSPQYPAQSANALPPQGNPMVGYPSQLPSYGQQAGQQMQPSMYQARPNIAYNGMTPLPNNPTPPLTPAAGGGMVAPPGFGSALGGMAGVGGPPQGMLDIKPSINAHSEEAEPRLTLPIRDGILLQPFRLEHNAPVSHHAFVLDDRTYHQLCTNPNIDLQLKCFHADDKTMSNNWPHNANIQICVNGTPVIVRLVEKPLYIKSLCQKQKNTLQIAVQQCCCSHLFLLTLVNRPTVDTIVKQLLRQRLLSPDHGIEKIRSFFHSGEAAQMRSVDGGDIVQMSINMSLKCPITMKRIDLPARGQECRHPQCFDLRSYLVMNKERSTWLCPICKRLAALESLEIDQYVWGILTNLSNCDIEDVTIDGAAAWKPVVRQSTTGGAMKEESEVPCNNAKRFKADPGASSGGVCTWGQPNVQSSPAVPTGANSTAGMGQQFATNGQASLYGRSNSVLSPFFPSNSPGSAFMNANPATPAACHPQGTGGPSANGISSTSSFSGPNTPRQAVGPLTPHNSRCGPATPATPLTHNPPSVGPPPRSVGNPPSVDNTNKGLHGSANSFGRQSQQLQQQSSVDASFSGSAPYTPVSVNSAGSQQSMNNATNTSTSAEPGAEFPDFTFDASDLLGGGDVTQPGASLFNDPEELMKYLADDTDFGGGGFAFNGNSNIHGGNSKSDNKQQRNSQPINALFDSSVKPQPTLSATTGHQQAGGDMTAADLASIDDILSFLDK